MAGFSSLSSEFHLIPLKVNAETLSAISGPGPYISVLQFKNRRMQAAMDLEKHKSPQPPQNNEILNSV